MFLELLFALLLLIYAWDYFNKKHRTDVLKKFAIPGPKTLPVLGNALDFININNHNLIATIRDFKRKFGKVYRLWVFNQLTVVILDPKYLEILLSSQQTIRKSRLYDFLVAWLGRGLLLSWGKKWHARRKIITPTFHFKILEQFIDIFDHQSSIMVEKLLEKADGQTAIDIFPVVCLKALDIIAESAMGVKVNAQETPGLDYVQAIASISSIMAERFLKPLQKSDLLFRLTAPNKYRETQRCLQVLHKFTTNVIEQRRKTLEESLREGSFKNDAENSELNTKKRMALLDVLLQSTIDGQPLTNKDICEEVDTFMFEGHDTTTSAISFTLYLVARHPEVQAKLVEEIREILGNDTNKRISLRDLQEMKYMDLVIKESQRLYPSVPSIGRQITEDVTLGDIIIPGDCIVSMPLFMVLRDPDYFPNPNDFKPERFQGESDEKIHPFAYTPFSAGPRNCIGQKFAVLEIKSTVSKMLRHFELLPLGPDVKPVINLILRSTTGVHIGLKPRSCMMN